jgi:hypothetical protein
MSPQQSSRAHSLVTRFAGASSCLMDWHLSRASMSMTSGCSVQVAARGCMAAPDGSALASTHCAENSSLGNRVRCGSTLTLSLSTKTHRLARCLASGRSLGDGVRRSMRGGSHDAVGLNPTTEAAWLPHTSAHQQIDPSRLLAGWQSNQRGGLSANVGSSLRHSSGERSAICGAVRRPHRSPAVAADRRRAAR